MARRTHPASISRTQFSPVLMPRKRTVGPLCFWEQTKIAMRKVADLDIPLVTPRTLDLIGWVPSWRGNRSRKAAKAFEDKFKAKRGSTRKTFLKESKSRRMTSRKESDCIFQVQLCFA